MPLRRHITHAIMQIDDEPASHILEIESRQDEALRQLADLERRIEEVLAESLALTRRIVEAARARWGGSQETT